MAPETPETPAESFQGESLVKEEDIKEEVLEEALPESLVKMVEDVKQEVKAEGEEEIAELAELCRGKWACPSHYIHLFYDETDRGVECVLTSQLLAMRRALQPSFPQHDLYRSGLI